MHCALFLPILITMHANSASNQIIPASHAQLKQVSVICSNAKDDDDDPGKAITDDPHGPDPHGRGAHDENHDRDMPANNLDPYGNKKP